MLLQQHPLYFVQFLAEPSYPTTRERDGLPIKVSEQPESHILPFTLLIRISHTVLLLKIIPGSTPSKVFCARSFLNGKLGGQCRLHQLLFHVFRNTQALNQTPKQHGFWQTVTQIWSVSKFCPNTSETSQIPVGDGSFCIRHPVS